MQSTKRLPSDSNFRKDLVYLIMDDKANAYVSLRFAALIHLERKEGSGGASEGRQENKSGARQEKIGEVRAYYI